MSDWLAQASANAAAATAARTARRLVQNGVQQLRSVLQWMESKEDDAHDLVATVLNARDKGYPHLMFQQIWKSIDKVKGVGAKASQMAFNSTVWKITLRSCLCCELEADSS